MRLACLIAAAVSCLSVTPALARADDFSAEYKACTAKSDGYMDVDQCMGDELTRQEARMEKAYQAALRIAEDGQRAPLERSQAEFRTYRESWCGAKGAVSGSGRSQYHGQCMIRTTSERADALEGFDNP